MERSQYWMWTERKHGLSSYIQPSMIKSLYGDSWEEQAFAEDSAGPLGGCVWPSRSYSCSFCGRKFKSAQALGGHMNVHRRERARLNQSPSSNNQILHDHQHSNDRHNCLQNPSTSLDDFQYPPQICKMVYNHKPNSNNHGVLESSFSPSRVSAPPKITLLVPPSSSPTIKEHHKKTSLSSPPSWSNFVADRYFHTSNSKIKGDKNSKREPVGRAVRLNLVVCSDFSNESNTKEEAASSCKRQRTNTTTLPFFLKSGSVDIDHLQPKVFELTPTSIEDLDLELRLGNHPKLK